MKSTLMIKDLVIGKEMDPKAMTAVLGGNSGMRSAGGSISTTSTGSTVLTTSVGSSLITSREASSMINLMMGLDATVNPKDYGIEDLDFLNRVLND